MKALFEGFVDSLYGDYQGKRKESVFKKLQDNPGEEMDHTGGYYAGSSMQLFSGLGMLKTKPVLGGFLIANGFSNLTAHKSLPAIIREGYQKMTGTYKAPKKEDVKDKQ